MNNANNHSDENHSPPFDELPEEEMPILDGMDGIAEEGEEVVASREYEDAVVEAGKIISPNKKSFHKKMPLIFACVGAFLVGIIGWLGWSYWVDRDALATLTSDMLTARDRAESSKGNPEESGESAAASQIASRIKQIVVAPWWDQVLIRILNGNDLIRAQEESSDLNEIAKHRTANRTWWAEKMRTVENALAAEDRTIPSIQGEFDDLQIALPPHTTAGGFTDELMKELGAKIQVDIQNLTIMQDAILALLEQKLNKVTLSQNQDELLAAKLDFESPLEIDRNPPEVAESLKKITAQFQIVSALLVARDALQIEMTMTLTGIGNTDLESASIDSMEKTLQTLRDASFPDDSRYDIARQLNSQSLEKASEILAVLKVRDASLEWFATRTMELTQIETLSDMAVFANQIADVNPPQCDLHVVRAATENFAALVRDRVQALEEQQRLLEASIARHELCEHLLFDVNNPDSFMSLLEDGQIAKAASALLTAEPESDDQILAVQNLKDNFSAMLIARLQTMSNQSKNDASSKTVASEIRDYLANNSIKSLAPNFEMDSAELWDLALVDEDRLIYSDIQSKVNSPLAEIEPLTRWYLSPKRTKNSDCMMKSQVTSLVNALKNPSVTIRIIGLEWGAENCKVILPDASVAIVIDQTIQTMNLMRTANQPISALDLEQSVTGSSEMIVEISVNGQLSCSDAEGIFSGSTSSTLDNLRIAGRFSLPCVTDSDESKLPNKLLMVSTLSDAMLQATNLPPWVNSRAPEAKTKQDVVSKNIDLQLDNKTARRSVTNDFEKKVNLSEMADLILNSKPTTDNERAQNYALKAEFPSLLRQRLSEMAGNAKLTGDWTIVANEFRQCFMSKPIQILDPNMVADTKALWNTVWICEDQQIYQDVQRLSKSSLAELQPVANWYLDPARTNGISCPMKSNVLGLLEAISDPTVTLKIEGVEWSTVDCVWKNPQTAVVISIDETAHSFTLPRVSKSEVSLFDVQQVIKMPPDNLVRIEVNGQFDCSDCNGIFSGSGGVLMDALRTGGDFTLPFWNGNDQAIPPHKLFLISIPSDRIQQAANLPQWSNSSTVIEPAMEISQEPEQLKSQMNAQTKAAVSPTSKDRSLSDENFTKSIKAIEEMIEHGNLADAADQILRLKPKSEVQISNVEYLTDEFQNFLAARFAVIASESKSSGNWSDVAEQFRQCLDSNSVSKLAPRFSSNSAELWNKIALAEDKQIYNEIRNLLSSPLSEITPIARWYLDSSRTRGVQSPMQLQISALLEALQSPSVMIQIDGIQWSSCDCKLADTNTNVAVVVVVDETVHSFDFPEVTQNSMTLLDAQQIVKRTPETFVEFSVNGQFICSDKNNGIFKGTASVPMDDLRLGGEFSVPFNNEGNESSTPNNLLLISIPSDELRFAMDLPEWVDPRMPL